MYLPDKRLEIGASYSRLLQGQQGNSEGVDVWWQPYRVPLAIRSEYAHGPHVAGLLGGGGLSVVSMERSR